MDGLIIKNISDLYTVRCNNENIICKAKGLFRNKKIVPLVGDKVQIDYEKKIITKVYSRKNFLIRPPIANVDKAVIVMSVKEPMFSTNLVDKLINVIEFNNIKPILCLSKLDLINDMNLIDEYITYYKKIGYEVIFNTEIKKIKKILKMKNKD